jgi:hypothetical protein
MLSYETEFAEGSSRLRNDDDGGGCVLSLILFVFALTIFFIILYEICQLRVVLSHKVVNVSELVLKKPFNLSKVSTMLSSIKSKKQWPFCTVKTGC